MRFTKGNQLGAIRRKESIAEKIAQRIEKDGDNLNSSQFTALVNRFAVLTAKKRRRSTKEPEPPNPLSGSFADRLVGKEREDLLLILQIEAERLETRRKEWQAEQTERNE
jgi:hypothetical protein